MTTRASHPRIVMLGTGGTGGRETRNSRVAAPEQAKRFRNDERSTRQSSRLQNQTPVHYDEDDEEDQHDDDDDDDERSSSVVPVNSSSSTSGRHQRGSVFQDSTTNDVDVNELPSRRGVLQSSRRLHHRDNETPHLEFPGTPNSAEEMIYRTRRASAAVTRRQEQLESSSSISAAAQIAGKRWRRREGYQHHHQDVDSSLEAQLQSSPDKQEIDEHPHTPAAEQVSEAGSHQVAEGANESTPVDGGDGAAQISNRGGRGRGGRGSSRAGRGGRGAGRSRGTGAPRRRTRYTAKNGQDRSSDDEYDLRSPPPSEATQKLRDRQKELDRVFKRVSLAQVLALNVLMERSIAHLAVDRYAHEKVPERDQVQRALDRRLEKQRGIAYNFYKQQVEQQNRLYAAAKERIEQQFRVRLLAFFVVHVA